MIEFITRHADDISFWVIFVAAIVNYILLLRQKKAYRRLDGVHTATIKALFSTEMEYRDLIYAVKGFIDRHNEWHDRKIRFYYDQDGWHCCYADEMPQGDTFIDQEEITQQNENKDENQQSI